MKVKVLAISGTKKSALIGVGNAQPFTNGLRQMSSNTNAGFVSIDPNTPFVLNQEVEIPDNAKIVKEMRVDLKTGEMRELPIWKW